MVGDVDRAFGLEDYFDINELSYSKISGNQNVLVIQSNVIGNHYENEDGDVEPRRKLYWEL